MQLGKYLLKRLPQCSGMRLSNFVSLFLISLLSTSAGCKSIAVVILPDRLPQPDRQVMEQMKILTCSDVETNGWFWHNRRCISDGDPVAEYLGEIENYRDYIDALRGELQ